MGSAPPCTSVTDTLCRGKSIASHKESLRGGENVLSRAHEYETHRTEQMEIKQKCGGELCQ